MRLTWRGWLLALTLVLACPSAFADDQAGRWAATQIKLTGVANFDQNCPNSVTPGLADQSGPAPQKKDGPAWILPCRTLTTTQLITLLTQGPGQIVLRGVNLEPDPGQSRVDLSERAFNTRLVLGYSRVSARLYLDNLHLTSLDIDNTDIRGAMNAADMHTDDFVKLDNIYLDAPMDLGSAQIGSDLTLSALYCPRCEITGQDLHIGGNFYVEDTADVSALDFSNASIAHSLRFEGTDASDDTGDNPGKTVTCTACAITGDVVFNGRPLAKIAQSHFSGLVDFSNARITGTVVLKNVAFDKSLQMNDAVIGSLDINSGAAINTLVIKNALISESLLTQVTDPKHPIQIGQLYLNGTKIDQEFDISGLDQSSWHFVAKTTAHKHTLDLTNASVGSLSDCQNSWPGTVRIDSFSFEKIYHPYNVSTCPTMFSVGQNDNTRTDTGWIDWLKNSDPRSSFDPQPYLYLAKYFSDEGQDAWADDVRYKLKEIEINQDLAEHRFASWTWLTAFKLIAGFEIWHPGFWHLLIVIGLSILVGFAMLLFSPEARKHSLGWCLGACFEKLLPLVQLNKSFRDFFDEPDEEPGKPKLAHWQKGFFTAYSLWGWLIGYLFLAMLSGVTNGS